MKKIVLILLSIALCKSMNAQSIIQAQLSAFKRSTPLMGLNGNAIYNNTWTNAALVDSIKNLNPSILRYPGGTPGNYWDWNTGWPIAPFSMCYPNAPSPALTVRLNELKIGLESCQAAMLYTLNMLNSNLSYQLQGIHHAFSLMIPIKYIEFGNEHNLKCDPIASVTYAAMSKTWADSIKSYYPSSKICLVGGDIPNAAPNWIKDITAQAINYDAFSFHIYPLPALSTFNVKNALSIAYNTTGQRYAISHFNNVPSKEVWVTEYNMSSGNTALANSWIQSLFLLSMVDTLIQKTQVTMMLPWAYSGPNLYFQSLDYNNFSMKASGVAVKLINDVSRGLDSCQKINFSPIQYQNYNGINYPKIFGYKFYDSTSTKAIFVNLSSTEYNIDVSSIGSDPSYTQYYADTAQLISNGYQSLTMSTGNSTNILMNAYSVIVVNFNLTTNIIALMKQPGTLKLFPNPVNKNELNLPNELKNFRFKIFNSSGQVMLEGSNNINIDISNLNNGMYYIILTFPDKKYLNAKFIKL